MNFWTTIASEPQLIVCIVIIAGFSLGELRIEGISLGLVGTLYSAIIIGIILFNQKGNTPYVHSVISYAELVSNFGTVLFSSVIGITSGYSFFMIKNKSIGLFLGSSIVCVDYLIMRFITRITKVDRSLVYGFFCGAMTSTPGLSAGSELFDKEKMITGYGLAYIVGVTVVVSFSSIIAKNNYVNETIEYNHIYNARARDRSSMIQIPVAIVFGAILGKIKLPFICFSLGNTGGIILSGIIVGSISVKLDKTINRQITEIIKKFGLILFLAGNGLICANNFDYNNLLSSIPLSLLFSALPVLFGYYLSKKMYGNNVIKAVSSVCGIMTSTPAYGKVSDVSDSKEINMIFSSTYIGALIAMLICMRIT